MFVSKFLTPYRETWNQMWALLFEGTAAGKGLLRWGFVFEGVEGFEGFQGW